jgi:ATP-dependent Lon protease
MDIIKINSIRNFQLLFRFKMLVLKSINNKLDLKYNLIYSMMKRINDNFKNDIIPQFKYNLFLNKLDSIISKFMNIPRPFNLKNLINIKVTSLNTIFENLDKELMKLSMECGTYTIFDLFYISTKMNVECLKKNCSAQTFRLLQFYNNVFIPTNYIVYDGNIVNTKIESSNNTQLTIYDPSQETFNEKTYDILNISKIDEYPICKATKKQSSSIMQSINGARIYFPLILNKNKVYIVVNGFFGEDPLNMSRIYGTIGEKNKQILESIKNLNINDKFKYGYIEQLSLRDFIAYDNKEIIEKCLESYNELLKLKEKTISSLVKDFLLNSVEKQRHILTLFLLLKDDIETQYLAHLMYDMISNESYLLKPQPLAEQVYNSLHWSIKKLFKVAIKRVSDYTKKILTFNDENIPYEKRICLLKAPDYVKAKAMEKYKEISNKSNENTSKSQQYLDGLLRIPFGIYKREKIINFLNIFKSNISLFVSQTITDIETQKHTELMLEINKKILEVCNEYKCNNLTSKDVDDLLNKLKNITNNIMKELLSDNEDNLEELINKFDKKKLSEYKKLINFINQDFEDEHKLSCKGKKKDLKNNIYQFINNLTNQDLKDKYILYLKNQERNIDDIIKIINTYFDSLIKKTNNYHNEWIKYKNNQKKYINNVEKILDSAVYGQEQAKLEIKRIIAQWINGDMKGYVFGFEGPPGTGKTSLAKKGIAKCLVDENKQTRPFSFIALGGSSNGSTLEGHSFTYVGSTWGKIADILIESKCMNPIIFIDELDKVSKTENGREIIGILTHITDPSQNDEYCDKYFSGIKLDLSRALFIFSYNDYSLIDPILADRIHRVKFNHLSKNDKIHIINNYLLPELLETVGFSKNSLKFSNEVIDYIILNYTFEAGIRKLKEKIFEIVRELNLRSLINDQEYKEVTIETIKDIFSKKPKMIFKKIANKPHIGLVNGLYATSCGIGGLTIIETFKTPHDSRLSLILTGQQGDVMQESVKCAKTIAWNLIPADIKTKIKKDWDDNGNYGIHVHCPEAATPKDGPSAGAAITLAIISLLCNIPVKNTVAMTGEIDLNGSVHQIGGLDFKIDGGKLAGAQHILCPENNRQDLEIFKKDKPEIIDNIKITCVRTIWEVLEHALVKNDIKFNKYLEK